MNTFYGAAVRDGVFVSGALIESRASQGQAVRNGNEIVATDRLDDNTLSAACDDEMSRVRELLPSLGAARVRIVVRATTDGPVETTMTVMVGGVSIATTPMHAVKDLELLRKLSGAPALLPATSIPLVWRNGTAAVLLHEAAGHAAEHGHARLDWPRWLSVHDGDVDLLAGEVPKTLRRESFADIPLPRMTNVVVTQHDAPFAVPEDHIDVLLVAGGAYEPLTETVTVDIAVAERTGERVAPFSIRASRATVVRSLLGATGVPIRYPA